VALASVPSIDKAGLVNEKLELLASDGGVEVPEKRRAVLSKVAASAAALVLDASDSGVLAVEFRPHAVDACSHRRGVVSYRNRTAVL
jgi:hypothetical protein